ncbi:MAG TPA: sensor histidine kinase [Chloroflexota bacterium]|jgi:two-component system sensor histidine kinase YesM|nr:sensor histidine kinase [Chloroflexota bacterium]
MIARGFRARRSSSATPFSWWRRASLGVKIHVSYLVLITIPLFVVAMAAYTTATTTIKQNAQDFSGQLTDDIRKNLDVYTQQAVRLTYWPFQTDSIQRVLSAHQTARQRALRIEDIQVMNSALADLGQGRADIEGIYIVTRNGTLFHWNASGALRYPMAATDPWYAWYSMVSAGGRQTRFLPTQQQSAILVTTDKVISLVRPLQDRHGRMLGAVRVDLDANALANVVQRVDLGTQGRLLVVTPAGQVVYPIDPTPAVQRLARDLARRRGAAPRDRLQLDAAGQPFLATYSVSEPSGWIVAGVVPADQLLTGANRLRAFILTVAALCVLAGALCATLVVNRLTRPVRQLRGAMRRVEARDLDTRIAVSSEDEVGQLAQGFNAMLDELRRLVDDVLRAQIHEREAELHALQNQINPHFLYNTLESINMLALTHGDREISRMVTSLGRLLRLTISSTAVLIRVRDELEYVNHYLVVQRMRYGDRISMLVDVDADILDSCLPKLTLQPLVENALYHGLEPQRGVGHVVVRGRRAGADLLLSVEDDGVGMDAAALAAVNAMLDQEPLRGSRSVGLANVQQRIKLYCGPAYGLIISSVQGQGTTVTVRIPYQLQAPMENTPPGVAERRYEDVSIADRRR